MSYFISSVRQQDPGARGRTFGSYPSREPESMENAETRPSYLAYHGHGMGQLGLSATYDASAAYHTP